MKKTLLAIALASTLCACQEPASPTNIDQLDEIQREQRFMINQMEHIDRRRRSEELHRQYGNQQ